jgi:hypothetical protein
MKMHGPSYKILIACLDCTNIYGRNSIYIKNNKTNVVRSKLRRDVMQFRKSNGVCEYEKHKEHIKLERSLGF